MRALLNLEGRQGVILRFIFICKNYLDDTARMNYNNKVLNGFNNGNLGGSTNKKITLFKEFQPTIELIQVMGYAFN